MCHVCHVSFFQRLSEVENHSDEMDLFNLVLRKFKKIHYKQEQNRDFKTYEFEITESAKV